MVLEGDLEMNDLDIMVPKHVGIIMDGNGRWAKERGLPRSLGHKEGANNLKKLLPYVYDTGVRYVTVYAFSTENFSRNSEEVNYLMNLFTTFFKKDFQEIIKRNVKVVFSGRRDPLPASVLESMDYLTEATKDGENGILNICINYGSQFEIVDMVKKISEKVVNKEISISDITKEVVEENLYNELPPIDLVIRTSGEQRCSNFMMYQSAYAEYYFPKTYFPDFDFKEFDLAIEEYNKRNRRFGGN